MTAPPDRPGEPAAGIWRWLVRLRPSGQVCWCGSVHAIGAQRGDQVVVATATGPWAAEVLSVSPPAADDVPAADTDLPDAPAPAAEQLSGEVLRRATAADRTAATAAATAADRLRTRASDWLGDPQRLDAPTVVILSAEVSLDLRVGVIRVLGPTDPRFGRAAAQLADALQLQRVQWMSVQEPQSSGGRAAAANPSPPLVMSPEEAADELFWERFEAVVRDGRSLGSGYRIASGNRGLYQQKRRGAAPAGRRLPSGRSWMIRVRTAAGGIATGQLDQLIQLADSFGDGSLRLTTRQAIQLHGVLPAAAPEVMQRLHQAALFTAGSCGNAVRNLTCCPMPPRNPVERMTRKAALQLAADLLPRGPAFEFRSGDSTVPPQAPWPDRPDDDRRHLPHKWKVGVTNAGHNCIDVLTNDLAVVVRGADRSGSDPARAAADVYVGGSTAYQSGRSDSFARLACWLGRVPLTEISAVATAALAVFRQAAVEGPRHWQRWKYTVQRLGIDRIADQIQQAGGDRFLLCREPAAEPGVAAVQTHHGLWRQADGRLAFACPIPTGRLAATGPGGAALRRLTRLAGSVRVGPRHTLVLADVPRQDEDAAQGLLGQLTGGGDGGSHGVGGDHGDRDAPSAVACPALPTCPLAVAAAETERHRWVDAMRPIAASAGVTMPDLAISGCSNGCSHPLTTAIGVVAETPRQWAVFLGGDGTRMGQRVAAISGPEPFAGLLADWLHRFAAGRGEAESFSDWFWRQRGA